jgi:hypothetical protein
VAADLAEWLTTHDDRAADAPAAPTDAPAGPAIALDDPSDIHQLLDDLDSLSPEEVDSLLNRLSGEAASEI